MRSRGRSGFWRGVIAALVMLVVMLAARLVLSVPTPVELFVDWFAPRLPLSWFETGISTFGGYAKPLFDLTLISGILIIGGLLGILYARLENRHVGSGRLTALVYVVLLTLITGLGFLPLTGEGLFGSGSAESSGKTMGAYLAAYLAFGLTLVLGHATEAYPADSNVPNPARREVLRTALLVGAGIVALPILYKVAKSLTVTNLERRAEGMPEPVTPADKFYVVSKNTIDPHVNMSTWKLSIGGLVNQPYELNYSELTTMPSVEQTQTLECISNPIGGNLISNARWKGVRLRELLQRAGVKPGTVDIRLTCADGYVESIPLSKAMEDDVVVAYEMNDQPLTYRHGAPARLLVPNIYGMKNTKWLMSIQAVDYDVRGYWEQQGWSDVATIQTMSQIRVPENHARVQVGHAVPVGGIAFAGSRGIKKVEWSADGGSTWREASLLPPIGEFSWRFWQDTWMPDKKGVFELQVRATDGTGQTQTSIRTDTLPNGATGYDSQGITSV